MKTSQNIPLQTRCQGNRWSIPLKTALSRVRLIFTAFHVDGSCQVRYNLIATMWQNRIKISIIAKYTPNFIPKWKFSTCIFQNQYSLLVKYRMIHRQNIKWYYLLIYVRKDIILSFIILNISEYPRNPTTFPSQHYEKDNSHYLEERY